MERHLRVNLLGPGPRVIKKKKNLPGRGLTKVEKHWCRILPNACVEGKNCVSFLSCGWKILNELLYAYAFDVDG